MKVGDMVQMSREVIMCESQDDVEGSGVVLELLFDRTAMVLWEDGKIEEMYEADMVVISEGR